MSRYHCQVRLFRVYVGNRLCRYMAIKSKNRRVVFGCLGEWVRRRLLQDIGCKKFGYYLPLYVLFKRYYLLVSVMFQLGFTVFFLFCFFGALCLSFEPCCLLSLVLVFWALCLFFDPTVVFCFCFSIYEYPPTPRYFLFALFGFPD